MKEWKFRGKVIEKKKLIQAGLLAGGVIVGFVILGFLISVLTSMIGQQNSESTSGPQVVTQPPTGTFLSPQAAAEEIFLPDIIISNEVEQFWEKPWIPYREQRSQWTLEEVGQFWIDPILIGTETLSEQNRQKIRDFLKTID